MDGELNGHKGILYTVWMSPLSQMAYTELKI